MRSQIIDFEKHIQYGKMEEIWFKKNVYAYEMEAEEDEPIF